MPRPLPRLAAVALVASAGCATLIGFPDYSASTTGTGGAGGAGAGTTSTPASSSSGAGGAGACATGAPCYLGLDGTEGVGACKGGAVPCDGGVTACSDVRPAVQTCGAPTADENCDGIPGCTGQVRWARGGLTAISAGIAAGVDGTVALVGSSTGAPGFSLSTYDALGRPCWAAPLVFDGGGALGATAVALSGAGHTLDGRATQILCPGGAGAQALAARTVVVGNAMGPVNFGQGQQVGAAKTDGFVAVVDPTGKVAWGQIFGSDGDDTTSAVATDAEGAIYVTGNVAGPLSVLPCTGAVDGGAGQGPGAFVAKLSPDGTCGWIKVFTGTAAGTGVAIDGSGRVTVTGTFSGSVDFDGQVVASGPGTPTFLARILPDGSVDGTPQAFGCADGAAPFVAAAPDGNVFALCDIPSGGGCGGMATDPGRAVLAHLDPAMGPQAYACYSGTAAVNAAGLAVDTAGNVVVLLATGGPVDGSRFMSSPQIPVGGVVAFKLPSPYTDYAWATVFGAGTSFQGLALAVDGMGDVALAGTPATAIHAGAAVLPGGGAYALELAP